MSRSNDLGHDRAAAAPRRARGARAPRLTTGPRSRGDTPSSPSVRGPPPSATTLPGSRRRRRPGRPRAGRSPSSSRPRIAASTCGSMVAFVSRMRRPADAHDRLAEARGGASNRRSPSRTRRAASPPPALAGIRRVVLDPGRDIAGGRGGRHAGDRVAPEAVQGLGGVGQRVDGARPQVGLGLARHQRGVGEDEHGPVAAAALVAGDGPVAARHLRARERRRDGADAAAAGGGDGLRRVDHPPAAPGDHRAVADTVDQRRGDVATWPGGTSCIERHVSRSAAGMAARARGVESRSAPAQACSPAPGPKRIRRSPSAHVKALTGPAPPRPPPGRPPSPSHTSRARPASGLR